MTAAGISLLLRRLRKREIPMRVSKFVGTALAFAVAFASTSSDAADYYQSKRYSRTYRLHREESFPFHIGGHLFGWQRDQRPFTSAENYPGWYNNQTFWERVQTQRNYPVQY